MSAILNSLNAHSFPILTDFDETRIKRPPKPISKQKTSNIDKNITWIEKEGHCAKGSVYSRIRILYFNLHDVMKTVSGAQSPRNAKRFV